MNVFYKSSMYYTRTMFNVQNMSPPPSNFYKYLSQLLPIPLTDHFPYLAKFPAARCIHGTCTYTCTCIHVMSINTVVTSYPHLFQVYPSGHGEVGSSLLPPSCFVTCSSDNTTRFWCLDGEGAWSIKNQYSKVRNYKVVHPTMS